MTTQIFDDALLEIAGNIFTARVAKNMSLAEVSQQTHIPLKKIDEIEMAIFTEKDFKFVKELLKFYNIIDKNPEENKEFFPAPEDYIKKYFH